MKTNKNTNFKNIDSDNNVVIDLKRAYQSFDWIYYTEYYNDVSKKNFKDKLLAWNYWYESNSDKTFFFKTVKKGKIQFENFDWITYIAVNKDLSHMNREEAWHHWRTYGMKENRGFEIINSSCSHQARLGNLFFVNMALHFIALRNNLYVTYKYNKEFIELGIRFFTGRKSYDEELYLTEDNFFEIIKRNIKLEKNIIIDSNKFFCQNSDFCFYIKEQFNYIFKENIQKKNLFKHRYNNNNDIFVHVRMGDLKEDLCFHANKNYYDKMLETLTFENGYISSDSIESDICDFLIKKYDLIVINYDEVKTIMFASTCDKIILSGGTFSWLIGFLAFYADKIYYPNYKNTWYDDIFVFDEWVGIDV
jgi:hypothetical protein